MTGLFFKHLFASIRKRPIQPILLILVIALSVAVCVTAFHTRLYLNEESRAEISAQNGNADFTVAFSSDSDVRFLFENEIIDAVGESCTVCGTFSVPMYYGEDEEFYYGVATAFQSVVNIFDLTFTEANPVRHNDFDKYVYVCEEFAKENNIKLGDSIELTVLGTKRTFVVAGISPANMLGEYALMIDMSALVRIILTNSTFEMLLGSDFVPSTKVFVKVNGNVTKAMDKILADEGLENAVLTRITSEEGEERKIFNSASKSIVLIIIMLAVLFTFAVIYVCFAVLTAQRNEENALFYAAGAKASMLNSLSIAEMLIYWLIGGVIGIGLSYAVAKLYVLIGNFHYCQGNVTPWTIPAALGITLAAAEGSMGIFILTDYIKKKKARKHIVKKEFKAGMLVAGIMFAIALLLCGLTFIEDVDVKKFLGILGVLVLCITAFYGSKQIFPKVAHSMAKGKKLPVSMRYAIKNASKIDSLANSASVVVLLIVVMASIAIIYAYALKSVVYETTFYVGDYLVQNLTDSGIDALNEKDEIDKVYGVFFDTGHIVDDDFTYILLSADTVDAFAPYLNFHQMPNGNEVYMCKELALHMRIDIGDTFTVNMRGMDFDFVFADYIEAGSSRLFFNYNAMGLAPTCYEVIGADGVPSETVKSSIASALTFENATIIPASALTKTYADQMNRYVVCIEFVSMFLLIFSFIGIIDNVVSSYKSRSEEFACFKSAGMNKSKIRRMIANEIAYVCIFAIIVAGICSAISFTYVYQIIRAFTDNLFYLF